MSRIGIAVAVGMALTVSGCGGSTPPASPSPSDSASSGTVTAGAMVSDRSHYENVVEMIQGKAPGLNVIQYPDGTIQLRIRGLNQSLQETGQEPLVVIDGVPSGRPAGQALMSMDPRDVSSIEVLRDVGSTAVYGTRGANGVILVRTRRR